MADGTHIQWTDRTFNVVSGCTKISDGCLKCYIERTPPFRMVGRKFDKPGIGGTTGVTLHHKRLPEPLGWRNPSRVFVCSLADLFHNEVPDAFIADLFAVMALTPKHTYQILTKRHGRLRSLLNDPGFQGLVADSAARIAEERQPGRRHPGNAGVWPLPNVWVGVSAENQQWADARIPTLLDTPAAVRWVSAEPLLGPISMRREWTATGGVAWLVAGGESGPGSRPCEPDWIRSLVEQCQQSGVAPFVKQFGSVWARDKWVAGEAVARTDPKGGKWENWPTELRIREYPAERVAVTA